MRQLFFYLILLFISASAARASFPAPVEVHKNSGYMKGIKVSQLVAVPNGTIDRVSERKLTVKTWMQVSVRNNSELTQIPADTQNRFSDYFSVPALSMWQTVLISSAIFLIVALAVLVCTPLGFKNCRLL